MPNPRNSATTIAPPTVAMLRAQGVAGARVFCENRACGRYAEMTWEKIGAPDDTQFPAIGKARRFICSACGSRDVTLMPDWPKW